jgi:hypothetical protein
MKRALIKDLHAVAKERREGYLEACLRAGKISRDGQWMIFDDAAHTKIRVQFNPHRRFTLPLPLEEGRGGGGSAGRHGEGSQTGLGDLLHKVAGPIGKAIHWPCLKGDGTTDLKPGSPCDRARRKLNKVQF